MLKSRESMVENHWELCRMINHMVNDYAGYIGHWPKVIAQWLLGGG